MKICVSWCNWTILFFWIWYLFSFLTRLCFTLMYVLSRQLLTETVKKKKKDSAL